MVGRKLALALGALLILAVVSESNELKVDENAKIEETRVASAHLNNNKHTKKIVLPSAVQTLVHRVLKTKDDGDVESGRKKGENADGTERDLESRAWFTNMQVKKDNIFEEDVGPEPRAAGKPKSGKKKKKTTKKKAGSRRRKRNRGKGKGGRSRGRGKGRSPGKGHSGGYGGKGRSKGGGKGYSGGGGKGYHGGKGHSGGGGGKGGYGGKGRSKGGGHNGGGGGKGYSGKRGGGGSGKGKGRALRAKAKTNS